MKIMKKVRNISLLCIFAVLISCSDFLEIAPPSAVNAVSFYKTESDILQALSAAYAGVRGVYTGRTSGLPPLLQLQEVRAEDFANGNVNDDVVNLFQIDGGSEWYRWNWLDSYYAINTANIVIDRAPVATMDDTMRKRVIAEAKFLRALIYFHLNVDYGGVPLVLNETTSFENTSVPRATVADTYTQIINDLMAAAADLPLTYTGADIGRATSGAAKGLLGKVYLQSGNASAAVPVLQEVVNSNIYELLPVYQDVFKPNNHNNKESLFEIQHKANLAGSPYGNYMATANWGGAGQGYNYDLPATTFINLFDPDDKRLVDLFATDGTGTTYTKKYLDPAMTVQNNGDTNFPVLRYADILLLLAEALGESTEAYGLINQVRERAGLPDIDGSTPGDFIDKVMNERRFEFPFELQRWHDILRLGPTEAIALMNDYFVSVGKPEIVIDEHDLLHAVPCDIVRVTNGIVQQNPGYPSCL
jgi:starch-binding outer membrane protein, SusD/RagB family